MRTRGLVLLITNSSCIHSGFEVPKDLAALDFAGKPRGLDKKRCDAHNAFSPSQQCSCENVVFDKHVCSSGSFQLESACLGDGDCRSHSRCLLDAVDKAMHTDSVTKIGSHMCSFCSVSCMSRVDICQVLHTHIEVVWWKKLIPLRHRKGYQRPRVSICPFHKVVERVCKGLGIRDL